VPDVRPKCAASRKRWVSNPHYLLRYFFEQVGVVRAAPCLVLSFADSFTRTGEGELGGGEGGERVPSKSARSCRSGQFEKAPTSCGGEVRSLNGFARSFEIARDDLFHLINRP